MLRCKQWYKVVNKTSHGSNNLFPPDLTAVEKISCEIKSIWNETKVVSHLVLMIWEKMEE